MDKYEAIYNFFELFGLPVYEENSVPTDDPLPEFPYLTYESSASYGDAEIQLTFSIWYRDTGMDAIDAKAQEISQKIRGLAVVDCDEGSILIRPAESFIQSMNDDSDPLIKRKLFTVYAKFITIF
jgi:hypothetical protein